MPAWSEFEDVKPRRQHDAILAVVISNDGGHASAEPDDDVIGEQKDAWLTSEMTRVMVIPSSIRHVTYTCRKHEGLLVS